MSNTFHKQNEDTTELLNIVPKENKRFSRHSKALYRPDTKTKHIMNTHRQRNKSQTEASKPFFILIYVALPLKPHIDMELIQHISHADPTRY